jgi:tetratricopeptide (TPR) repeat protein
MYWQGEWEGTLEPYQEALTWFRAVGDDDDVAEALYNLGFPLMYAGELDRAEENFNESLRLSERRGRKIGVGRAYWGLGEIAVFREQWADAVTWNKRAADEFIALDAPFDLGWSWFMIAHSFAKDHRSEEAELYLERCLDIFAATTDVSALALIFDSLSLAALRRGDRVRAARMAGAGHRLSADTGVNISEVDTNRFPEMVEFLAHRSDAEEAAYQEGYGYTIEEAITYARGEALGQ